MTGRRRGGCPALIVTRRAVGLSLTGALADGVSIFSASTAERTTFETSTVRALGTQWVGTGRGAVLATYTAFASVREGEPHLCPSVVQSSVRPGQAHPSRSQRDAPFSRRCPAHTMSACFDLGIGWRSSLCKRSFPSGPGICQQGTNRTCSYQGSMCPWDK